MTSQRDPAGTGRALTSADIDACVEVLEALAADRAKLAAVDADTRRRLLVAAGRVSRPERAEQRDLAKAFRRREHDARKASDGALLNATGIRAARRDPVFRTPDPPALRPAPGAPPLPRAPSRIELPPPEGRAARPELGRARKCYVCKAEFRAVHFFYDSMCTPCGDFNHAKRSQSASLEGRVALVTGARVKIGYQAAMMLLRAGAHVIVTTRFPRDAAQRYAAERDFDAWRGRLSIYGLDLRHTPSVDLLARHLGRTLDRLDFVINNACQTVRRPPGFYAHLIETESAPAASLPERARPLVDDYEAMRRDGALPAAAGEAAAIGLRAPAPLSQVPAAEGDAAGSPPGSAAPLAAAPELFPEGLYDADLQQVDLRDVNSWRLGLGDVPTVELLEVHLVNAVAPFVLNARLKPLLVRHRTFDRHIVNVSAVEGQFYRAHKTDRHPHTNMAKAALNMMTRTSAPDYAKDGVFMNSVDTGWVTDEDPAAIAARKVEEHGFHPPLDIVDGAARVCDPIFSGLLTGKHVYGQFLKDYMPTEW